MEGYDENITTHRETNPLIRRSLPPSLAKSTLLRVLLAWGALAAVDGAAEQKLSPIFLDVTEKAGIDFVHDNGMTGQYYLPEITGAGGALFDYDNDGDLDIYLIQGGSVSDNAADEAPGDRLYRNNLSESGLTFTDVTETSGISASSYGMGVAAGDVDNDGWTDLYVTALGTNHLFVNNGDGTFTDATQSAGVDDPRWSTSAAFFDYDADGWLDLFVTHYVKFDPGNDPECFANNSARDYCGPDAFEAISDRLFHNRGDGTFEDVTAVSGVKDDFGAGLGVVTGDFNGDGTIDIYVANDGDANQLWINQKNGSFENEALLAGVAFNALGRAEAGIEFLIRVKPFL